MLIKRVLILSIFFFSGYLAQDIARAEEVLTWNDCLVEAKKNNPDLISAAEGISEQKAGKAIAASTLYPQVNANLYASTAKTSSDSGGSITSSTKDSYSYGLDGTQLIFDGFQTVNKVKAASQDIKAAEQNFRFTSSQVRLDLRSAFIDLLRSQEMINVARDILKIRRDNLLLIAMRYEAGLEHRGALLTAEANVSQADYELAQAEREVEVNQRKLAKAMGRREFKPVLAKGDFVVRDNANNKPDFQELIKRNPSLLQAIAQKNSAAFSLRSAYGSFSPQLSGSGGIDKSGSHWSPKGDGYNAGLNLTMPVFEGGLRIAQVNQAKALYNQADANERSIRDAALVSLGQSWADLKDTITVVDVQHQTLQAAEERAKISEAQYSIGFITFDNWIIIQDDLVKAKRNYLNAQADALLAEANWIYAKGETLEYAQ